MPKISDCDRCLNNAHSNYLVCAIHPDGVDGNSCPDFADDGQELWCIHVQTLRMMVKSYGVQMVISL